MNERPNAPPGSPAAVPHNSDSSLKHDEGGSIPDYRLLPARKERRHAFLSKILVLTSASRELINNFAQPLQTGIAALAEAYSTQDSSAPTLTGKSLGLVKKLGLGGKSIQASLTRKTQSILTAHVIKTEGGSGPLPTRKPRVPRPFPGNTYPGDKRSSQSQFSLEIP